MDGDTSPLQREPRQTDGPETAGGSWSPHPERVPPAGGEGPPGAWPQTPQGQGEGPSQDEKNMGMLVHVLAFAGLVIPIGNIIGPLILWLVKKQEMPFVDWHGKQALNFNISVTIYAIVSAVLVLVLIGIFMLIALGIFWLVMTIVNAMKASNGEWVKYPLTIEFLK